MSRWKTVASCSLAVSLAALGPVQAFASPEFAYDSAKWEKLRDNVMEYGELADLVHEYNPTIQNNRVTYADEWDKDKNDVSDEYWELALELFGQVNYPDEDAANYSVLYANARNAEIMAAQYKQKALQNMDDGTIRKHGYDQAEATVVSTAQASMISYKQSLLQLEQEKEAKKLAEETYNSVQAKVGAGMATQADLLSSKQSVLDAEASIQSLQRTIQNTKQNLCLMTGWSYNAEPEICEIPSADLARIDAMNPTEDKNKAIEQNFTLLINQRKLQNASESVSIETLRTTVNDNKQKIASDIDVAYNAVQQAKVAYQQAQAELDVESRNMAAAEQKQKAGTISRLDYVRQENAFITKQTNLKIKDMALYQAMETYNWKINGLAST